MCAPLRPPWNWPCHRVKEPGEPAGRRKTREGVFPAQVVLGPAGLTVATDTRGSRQNMSAVFGDGSEPAGFGGGLLRVS